MKKGFVILLIAVLFLYAMIPTAAYAELVRGNSGKEVMKLQERLFDMGYLMEEPDGKFGGKTEAGVKEYQKAVGLAETGVVTDELMEKIYQDWLAYWEWVYEQQRLDRENYSPFCYTWENTDGLMVMEHCEKHALLWETTQGMLSYGDADSAEYSYYEWQAEIISLYNEWISLVSEPVQAQLEVNKALVIQMLEVQRKAMFDSYDAVGTEIDSTDVYYGAELWMRTHCAWLCQMLSTLDAE